MTKSLKEKKKKVESAEKRKLIISVYKQFGNKEIKTHIICRICGKKCKNLAAHLRFSHEVTPKEYQVDFPETKYFISEDLRVKKSREQANYLTNKKRNLEKEEITFVKENFMSMTVPKLAEALDLSKFTIMRIIIKYVPEIKGVGKVWTEEEEIYIKKHHKHMSYIEIAKKLQRGAACVWQKANQLGLDKHGKKVSAIYYPKGAPEKGSNEKTLWTKKEEAYIGKNRKNKTIEEMAVFLGRTPYGVHYRLKKLRLLDGARTEKGAKIFWKNEDLEMLEKKYKTMTIEDICKILGRSKSSVYKRAYILGLKKK